MGKLLIPPPWRARHSALKSVAGIRGGQPSWGALSLGLKLPALNIYFKGLSRHQFEAINNIYPSFCFAANDAEVYDIVCDVFRLSGPPEIASDELSFEGQYAPRKVRNELADYINVTGVNFEAGFSLKPSGGSSLGVAIEKELAHANVIENYLRIISAHRVLQQQGVVLHSAGLVYEERAYIFSGRSNAGKTTLTRKAYNDGARVLSDDINLVLPGKSGYEAYAVPFTGEFGRTLAHEGGKESYPLAGIILLEQGDSLEIFPVTNAIAVARLLTGCPFVNTDEHESDALFDSVTALVESVPVARMLSRRNDNIDDIMGAVTKQFS